MIKLLKLLNDFLQLQINAQNKTEKTSAEMYFSCIKSIENGSNKITTWCLSILGGSLLAIISDGYLHPQTLKLKLIYFLFIIGWIFIGISLFNGKKILGSSIASELYKDKIDQLISIFKICNKHYSRQLLYFNWALLFFGIWLLLYLCWWIFGETFLYCIN